MLRICGTLAAMVKEGQTAPSSLPATQRDFLLVCVRGFLLCAAGPLVCTFIAEELCLSQVVGLAEGFFSANYALYLILHLIVFALVRRLRITCLAVLAFVLSVSIANHFVTAFTGIPITFGDLMSASTGFAVAGGYTYSLDASLVRVVVAALVYAAVVLAIPRPAFRVGPRRTPVLCASLLVCVLGVTGALATDDDLWSRIDTHEWNPAYSYSHYGFAMSLVSDVAGASTVEAPGYDPPTLWGIDSDTGIAQVNVGDGYAYRIGHAPHYTSATETSPHIIAIMNESFSDLTTYIDGYETSEDAMPYVRSLMARGDVVSGTCAVSSDRGTGTANSEFEFLTGNSMSFFKGSTPYVQYLDAPTPSLASELRDRGYQTLALHAYEKAGYNRVRTYNYLGFSTYKGIEDFDVDIRYARDYPTDETSYRQLITEFERNRAESQAPQLIFNVAMQNHGGYYDTDYEWPTRIHEVAPEESYDESVVTYESSVRMADGAVRGLIAYFKQIDEPVVILFFGDHEPRLSNEFYRQWYADDAEADLAVTATFHQTPFFMWSNYDWDIQGVDDVGTVSLNYLNTLLMEAAGMELSPYQSYLSDLRAAHPIVTARYFTDADGTRTGTTPDALTEDLRQYQWLQYNSVFDVNRRIPEFYS